MAGMYLTTGSADGRGRARRIGLKIYKTAAHFVTPANGKMEPKLNSATVCLFFNSVANQLSQFLF